MHAQKPYPSALELRQEKGHVRSYFSLGFTLIELLLVMALIFVIGSLSFALGLSFFKQGLVDDTAGDIVGILEKAQFESIGQKNDSAFGVKILPRSYVLFQGQSYAERITSEDESFTLPTTIQATGLSEVVFMQQSGLPTATGTISLSLDDAVEVVSINAKGTISR